MVSKLINGTGAEHFFYVGGDFGRFSGPVTKEETADTLTVSAGCGGCSAVSVFREDASGVISRTGYLKNDGDAPIRISGALARFRFDGGEYEVYTQYNGWENESMGRWQRLTTAVSASVDSPRTCAGAAPMLAVWNMQTQRGFVFHILADGAWEMTAKRVMGGGEVSDIAVDIGANRQNYDRTLAPGESLTIPEILCYPFTNKTDMDAWKLHRYMNVRFPMTRMPIIYNTWMYRYDKITYENLSVQVKKAAQLGAEYYVIDAGWFGVGENGWWELRGDWSENMTANLKGSMGKIADLVRANGMKFGFWLETESAGANAKEVKAHPDYFLCEDGKYFIDFANPAACDHIYGTICGLLDLYGAEFLKFDYNQDIFCDRGRAAFQRYTEGFNALCKRLRAAYPSLYLECCASGGLRMNLTNLGSFDSFWISDNHSPYEGVRILKDTVLRMPPQRIERWAVMTSYTATQPYTNEKILASNDCGWQRMVSIYPDFMKNFLTGGPIGISCDLNAFSDETFAAFRDFLAKIKEERPFWEAAECRLLTDTASMLVMQYSDRAQTEARILLISSKMRQSAIRIYPVLDPARTYLLPDGTEMTGAELAAYGIPVGVPGSDRGIRIDVKAK